MFQEGFLPTAFDETDDQRVSPRRGLADRGYHSTNPESKLYQCLFTVQKKPAHGHLIPEVLKMNQLIATVRVEVERALGRLRQLKRLVEVFTAKGSLEDKKAKHARLFKIAIHFTNYSFLFRPLRKNPHWLLCKGPLSTRTVFRRYNTFMESPIGTHISSCLKRKDLRRLAQYSEDENDEEQ